MRSESLPLAYVAGALLLALASCGAESLSDAPAPAGTVRISGRVPAEDAGLSVRLSIGGSLVGVATPDANGAFVLDVDGPRGAASELLVVAGESLRLRYEFPLADLVLPDRPIFVHEPAVLAREDLISVVVADPEATEVVVMDASERQVWGAPLDESGRATVPAEALTGLGCVVMARRVESAGAVTVETRSPGVSLGSSLPTRTVAVPVAIDGVAVSPIEGPVSFQQTLEFDLEGTQAPTRVLVRGWVGPTFVLERDLGDRVWEVLAFVPFPDGFAWSDVNPHVAGSRYRVRLVGPGAGGARVESLELY